jgi:hypothetical protein
MKRFCIIAALLLTAACVPAEMDDGAEPPQMESRVLFTSPEGCKLYKVRDTTAGGDSYVYMTVCVNASNTSLANDSAVPY